MNFTFWEWYYSGIKLIEKHLSQFWFDGKIMGFVSAQKADELLLKCKQGTFLLRFSDSEKGAISVRFVMNRKIYWLLSWSSNDLKRKGLADRLKDIELLKYLYPDIPKDKAFGWHFTPSI